jgi:hypothetical protein
LITELGAVIGGNERLGTNCYRSLFINHRHFILHSLTHLYYTVSVTIKVIEKVDRGIMDFTNRSVPTQHQDVESTGNSSTSSINVKRGGGSSNTNKRPDNGKWTRIGVFAGFIAVVILVVALIVLVAANNDNSKDTTEASYIKTSKLQAVFLNTGQVYFGNIRSLNNNYLILTNIFYLQTASSTSGSSSSTSGSNVSLVKLGCELHRPYDQMVINRSQVTFWENLESDGQVATAVATYQKDNPGPQKCVDQSTSSSTTSGTAAQGATTNNSAASTSGQ